MTEYLIQRHNICMSDPSPFNQHWEARVSVPLAGLDVAAALQPCASVLKSGDLINIAAFTQSDWQVLTEVAAFRVTSVHGRVKVLPVGDIARVPEEDISIAESATVRLHITQNGSAFTVEDESGNHLETFIDAQQAAEFIAREERRVRPADPTAAISAPRRPGRPRKIV